MSNISFKSHHHLLQQQQDTLKRRNSILQTKLNTDNSDDHHHRTVNNNYPSSGFYARPVSSAITHNHHPKAMFLNNSNMQLRIENFHGFHSVEFDDQQIKEDETLLKVIPKVTVVLEGRSIC